MLPSFLIIAGLFGAAGIALAAAGAHAAPRAGLDSAANILLFHAVAILAGAALLLQGVLSRPLAYFRPMSHCEFLWGNDFFPWPRPLEELS